jgi:hypothetical protein
MMDFRLLEKGWFMKKFLFVFLIFICSVAHSQFIELDIQGKKFTKTYPIGDGKYFIPLPGFEWTGVRGNKYTTSGTSSQMQEVVLSDMETKKLNMSMYVNAKIDGVSTRWLSEPCKGEDFIYKNDYKMTLWDQRCLTFKMDSYLQKTDNKVQSISRDFYSKSGIKHDYNAIVASYTQYTRGGKYLELKFYIFPSNYGFENPTTETLVTNPWFSSNYKLDPAKVKFVEALTVWAEIYSNILYKSFTEEKNQSTEIPKFEYTR